MAGIPYCFDCGISSWSSLPSPSVGHWSVYVHLVSLSISCSPRSQDKPFPLSCHLQAFDCHGLHLGPFASNSRALPFPEFARVLETNPLSASSDTELTEIWEERSRSWRMGTPAPQKLPLKANWTVTAQGQVGARNSVLAWVNSQVEFRDSDFESSEWHQALLVKDC